MSKILTIIVLSISAFLLSISMSVTMIFIPLELDTMLSQESIIGILLAIEPVIIVLLSLYLPRLLTLRSLILLLIVLIPIKILGSVLLSFSAIWAWAIAIGILAIANAGQLVLIQFWCNYLCSHAYKGAILGLFGTAVSSGLALGPYLVTEIEALTPYLQVFNWINLKDPNKLLLLFSLLSSLPLFLILTSSPGKQKPGGLSIWQCFNVSKGPLFAVAMAGCCFFSCAGFLVLYGIDNQHQESAPILLTAFILGALLLELPLAVISDYLDKRYMVVACAMISMTCVSYLPIAITDLTSALVLLFVWGGFLGAIYSISLALISERIHEDSLLQSSCIYTIMENAGGCLGLILTGVLSSIIGSDGLVYVLMTTSLCYFAFALTRFRVA
jgi:MFS family permease